jgi:PAS domain S-box-containing protein
MLDPGPLRKSNVLIVDDRPANLVALGAVLGDDHNIVSARSGLEAIAVVAERNDIDLVLLDVQMPEMDGFETALRLRELPGAEDLPIVFITATHSQDPYVSRGYQVGGIDYFSKPFDRELLRRKVQIYTAFRLKSELLRQWERRSRETLPAVLEHLPAGALIADSTGELRQVTDEAARVLRATGTERREAFHLLTEWWHAVDNELTRSQGLLQRALRNGESAENHRVRVRCVGGSVKEILASALPLREGDGKVVGVIVLVRDAAPRVSPFEGAPAGTRSSGQS